MPPPYNPVGRCIYCGVSEKLAGPKGLTDEHIIPYALGGTLILPKASCSSCANETHAFEGHLAGEMLEAARTHFHWKSRKRKRPTKLKTWTAKDGFRQVPIADHPRAIAFPVFDPPGILLNKPPVAGGMICHALNTYFAPDFKEKLDRTRGVVQPFQIDWIARTVAKIAHAYAVAELGIDGFTHLLTGIILGTDDHYSHYVGNPITGATNSTAELHTVSLDWMENLLVVSVRLYSRFNIGPYWVVSGRRKP